VSDGYNIVFGIVYCLDLNLRRKDGQGNRPDRENCRLRHLHIAFLLV